FLRVALHLFELFFRALFWRLPSRIGVAPAGGHLQARSGRAHLDFVKAPIPRMARRVIAEHVVGAVGADDAVERVVYAIAKACESAGLVRKRAQTVLRETHLGVESHQIRGRLWAVRSRTR